MRVVAGSRKSVKLKTVAGKTTRPTMDRTKETLFNILSPYIVDCNFLDFFAGSGGIGIEALSRGAKRAVFVEQDKQAIHCIKDNLRTTKFESEGRIMEMDVFLAIKKLLREKLSFDIIFIDPPFDTLLENKVLKSLKNSCLVHKDTIIVVEASIHTDFSYLTELNLMLKREKNYKSHKHVFINRIENT